VWVDTSGLESSKTQRDNLRSEKGDGSCLSCIVANYPANLSSSSTTSILWSQPPFSFSFTPSSLLLRLFCIESASSWRSQKKKRKKKHDGPLCCKMCMRCLTYPNFANLLSTIRDAMLGSLKKIMKRKTCNYTNISRFTSHIFFLIFLLFFDS